MPGAGTRSVESPWLACQRVYWISAARSEIALRLWRHAMTLGNAMRPLCETKKCCPLGDCTAPTAPCNDVGECDAPSVRDKKYIPSLFGEFG